jgi:hypothetical protein
VASRSFAFLIFPGVLGDAKKAHWWPALGEKGVARLSYNDCEWMVHLNPISPGLHSDLEVLGAVPTLSRHLYNRISLCVKCPVLHS